MPIFEKLEILETKCCRTLIPQEIFDNYGYSQIPDPRLPQNPDPRLAQIPDPRLPQIPDPRLPQIPDPWLPQIPDPR